MKKLLLFFLLLSLSMPQALAFEYTQDADVSFTEAFAKEPLLTEPGFSLKTPSAAYFFSPEIDQEQRDAIVETEEKLLSALGETGFTVYVLPDYPAHAEAARRMIFLSPLKQPDGGMQQAIATLQCLQGETAHYGLLFGAADELCKAAGLKGCRKMFKDLGMLRFYNDENNLQHFLLLYPSFEKDMISPSLLHYVKDMALRVYAYAKEQGALEELMKPQPLPDFQAKYVQLVNAFLKDAEAETRLHEGLPAISFGCGGQYVPLIVSSAHGDWIFTADYDERRDPGLPFYLASYDSIYQIIWRLEDEMAKVDQSLPEGKKERLLFLVDNADSGSSYQHYDGNGPMQVRSLSAVIHDYTHARLLHSFDGNENEWFLTELAATYFEMIGEYSVHPMVIAGVYFGDHPVSDFWQPLIENKDNDKSPLKNSFDPAEVYNFLCYENKQYDLLTPSSNTLNTLRAFSLYLKEMYGDEKVGAAITSQSPETALGQSWEGLRQEWISHLSALYGEGSAL